MNNKIIRFLEDEGYEGSSKEPAALQLLRYFEQEYDVNLLSLLEQEWVDEQIEQEISHEQFETIRELLDERHIREYDAALMKLGY